MTNRLVLPGVMSELLQKIRAAKYYPTVIMMVLGWCCSLDLGVLMAKISDYIPLRHHLVTVS